MESFSSLDPMYRNRYTAHYCIENNIQTLYIDDIVRGRPIYSTLLNHKNYLDVRLLCNLYEERLWLKEQPYLKDDLAFIQLALSTDYKDEPILMYAQKEERMLNRIQCLL